MNLNDVNSAKLNRFVELLGGIFEHSPWVAEQAYTARPFESAGHLHRTLCGIVQQASEAQRLALLRLHPELAGKEAAGGRLTEDSAREQAGAGLNQCTAAELAQIKTLNQAYRDRFDFPFIIAVSGLDKQQIIAAMQARLNNQPGQEFNTALAEVDKIARIRLDALLDD